MTGCFRRKQAQAASAYFWFADLSAGFYLYIYERGGEWWIFSVIGWRFRRGMGSPGWKVERDDWVLTKRRGFLLSQNREEVERGRGGLVRVIWIGACDEAERHELSSD